MVSAGGRVKPQVSSDIIEGPPYFFFFLENDVFQVDGVAVFQVLKFWYVNHIF